MPDAPDAAEAEDPNAGGMAWMALAEAWRHVRRAEVCGMLACKLRQEPRRRLDAETVGEVLLDLWIADPDLDPDRLLERLVPRRP